MKLLWAAAALAMLVVNVQAAPALGDLSSVELQMECKKADPEFCRGYIQAVSEGIMTRGVTVCVDTEATSQDDLMENVVPWIANYAGDLTDLSVYGALVALYPCQREGSE